MRTRFRDFPVMLVCAFLAATLTSSCENSGSSPPPQLSDYFPMLAAGEAVAEAVSYDGGPVPHKLIDIVEIGSSGEWMSAGWVRSLAPSGWFALSIEELQLVLVYTYTHVHTGRTALYIPGGTMELVHQIATCTLRKAKTGEVVASTTIEGDRKFPDSVTIRIGEPDDGLVYDKMDFAHSKLISWLQPYVER